MRRAGSLKYAILAAVLFIFCGSVVVNLLELQEKSDRATAFDRQQLDRAVGLAQIAFFQFLDGVQRYREGDPLVRRHDLEQRFDEMRTRLAAFRSGSLGEQVKELPNGSGLVSDLLGTLAAAGAIVETIVAGDEGAYRSLRSRLNAVIRPLQELAYAVNRAEEEVAAAQRARAGTAFWTLLASLVGFLVSSGALVFILVQEQRRAAALARVAEEAREAADQAHGRLIESIESIPEGIALFDADDRLVLFNATYLEMYARSADLMQIGAPFEYIIREGAKRGQFARVADIEGYVATRVARHRQTHEVFEQELVDGTWLQISERRTRDGGSIGVGTDITDLKRRESRLAELAQENARFAAAIDSASSGIAILDPHRNGRPIVFVNPAFTLITGYDTEQVIGRSLALLNGPETDGETAAEIEAAIAAGHPVRAEVRHYRRDGSAFWDDVTLSPIFDDDGALSAFVSIHNDITERKSIEADLRTAKDQAEEANRTKSAFFAVMSHEVRTPMNGVLGTLGMLLDTRLDQDQRMFVHTAKQSGEALLTILNDILDSSKLEAGKLDLELIDFDLHAVVNGIATLLGPRARSKGIEFVTEIGDDVPRYLHGDPGRLRQVLLNFSDNALKFTEAGRVSIMVRLITNEDDVSTLRFEVTDTGVGMTPEQRSRLFRAFTQADASISRRFGGTGLGLAICKQLVELMGGRVGAISAPNRGTRMWMEIPFHHGAAVAEANPIAEAAPTPREVGARSVRVLLAEDNPTNAFVLKAMLNDTGYQLDIVGNGLEAIEAVGTRPYDVVLMDVSMPEMDGLEATREIRNLPSASAGVPIVAMTALAMAGDRERCIAAGMNDYLPKPIDKPALLRALATWSGLERLTGTARTEDEPAPGPPTDPLPAPSEPAAPAAATPHEETVEAAVAIREEDDDREPVVDHRVLDQLAEETGKETMPMLVEVFVADCRARIGRIRDAVAAEDREALQREAHSLVSSAATFGAMRLSAQARAIEVACRQGRDGEALALAGAMPSLAEATYAAIALVDAN